MGMKILMILAACLAALTCPVSGQDIVIEPVREEEVVVKATPCPPPLADPPPSVMAPAPGPAGPQGPRGERGERGAPGQPGRTFRTIRTPRWADGGGESRDDDYRRNVADFRDYGGITRGEVAAMTTIVPAAGNAATSASEEGEMNPIFAGMLVVGGLLALFGLFAALTAMSSNSGGGQRRSGGVSGWNPGSRQPMTALCLDNAVDKGCDVTLSDGPDYSY
ncbi:MAG TPA: collagen-like protein, partial [Patescibacteria group bacterium]|nr:collagen-like protein [Patescibacteria group bacterium]